MCGGPLALVVDASGGTSAGAMGHSKCKDTASIRRRLRICFRDCVARLESSDDQCERLPRRMLES